MNEKIINKPITMLRQEFINNLTNTINKSKLSAFIIEPILKDFLEEIRIIAKKEYELDKKNYEDYLSNKEKGNDDNDDNDDNEG